MNILKRSLATRTGSLVVSLLLLASSSSAKTTHSAVAPGQLKNKKKGRGQTQNCKGRKCAIDTSNIDLATDGQIEFVGLGPNRKTINCRKKVFPGNGKAKRWYGSCDTLDVHDLVLVERRGKLTGSVQVDGTSCVIHDGQVECTPLTAFPDEEESLEEDEDNIFGRDRQLVVQQVRDYIAGFAPLDTQMTPSPESRSLRFINNHNNTQPRRRLYDDSGNNIDVLVVWSKQAECRYTGKGNGPECGLNEASYESMAALVDLLVAQSNVAFANSGVLFTIRLVHAYRHPTYVESTAGIATVLSQLRSTTDGIMDDVHQKRTLYGADLVHMIIGTNGCGVAYLGPSRAGAFSATRYTCAVGQYSFPHELAHSLGALHDRGSQNACSETGDTFRYGFRDTKGIFRSVMAYACTSNECDNSTVIPGNCGRVLLFSNPITGYTYVDSATNTTVSRPIGDARNNNVRQLNNQRVLAAGWYPAMDCEVNAECNDQNATTLDTCDTVNRVCIFTPLPPAPPQMPLQYPSRAPSPIPSKVTSTAPSRMPSQYPSPAPSPMPSKVTSTAPSRMPSQYPSPAPSQSPSKALTPISIPSQIPSNDPSLGPSQDPSPDPSTMPSQYLSTAPSRMPSPAPSGMPSKNPIPGPSPAMESLVVTGLGDTWVTVPLTATFISAVPVCSQQMDLQTGMNNAVVRIRNIGPASFDIKLQSAAGQTQVMQARPVHCIVVEQGQWTLPDGRKIEAQKFLSTVTANKKGWNVQNATYQHSYSVPPVVLGSVISFNDPKWSVFMAHGSTRTNRPTETVLKVAKLTGEDYSTRVDETLGIVVIESGHWTALDTALEAGRSGLVATGYMDTGVKTNNFLQVFVSAPTVLVVSQVGQVGADGSWAVLRDVPLTNLFRLAVDEDTFSDSERNHSSEAIDYMACSIAGVLPLTPA